MLDRNGKQIPMIKIMKRPEVFLSESGKKRNKDLGLEIIRVDNTDFSQTK